jgi:DNA (cytosine-5)-methyltransferase 1
MTLRVLDLFCGAGGLTSGFTKAGFQVKGADSSEVAGKTFELNLRGTFQLADLSRDMVSGSYDVVIGGPPCRPWSNVNTRTRDIRHRDYKLVGVFFKHVEALEPDAFLFENVLPVMNSGTFKWWLHRMENRGYSIDSGSVRYSDFGAATKRQRLIVFGTKNGDPRNFRRRLLLEQKPGRTVRSEIWKLRNRERGELPDHDWPVLRTIQKYVKFYKSGKYGWYILKWDEPAPSFGNVMKTYILHPGSFNGGKTRVISVKEAALIMGFGDEFVFPSRSGLGARYQMIADAVSPKFSEAVAHAIKGILNNDAP